MCGNVMIGFGATFALGMFVSFAVALIYVIK